MPNTVLILTSRDDLHADIVARKVASRGGNPFRIDLDDFPAGFDVELELDGACWRGMLTRTGGGDRLAVSDIGAVWMRKKADFRFRSADLAPQEHAFASAEAEHILFSLLYSLGCYWMSHPLAVRGALWKGEQLQRAARFGFAVPPSLITNRAAAAVAFGREAAQGLAFKALSSSLLAADAVGSDERIAGPIATTRLEARDETELEGVAELPCFFQHYVPKRHELRVTVIGERAFCARIHSQDDPRTATDYRDFSAEILYEAATLPAEVEHRCIAFVRSYGLTYGAIDLIVTPAGEHVFLENNPVGQFLFVEELVPALDMTGALADCLIAGAARRGACG
jgi:glutathione synthase/RimK-type ligase-like ATP-grasp enzyme